DWTCTPCSRGVQDPACVLCPRRGGALYPTDDKTARWVHAFCAQRTPGGVDGGKGGGGEGVTPTVMSVDVKSVPKELKKQKCQVCGRKQGAQVKCCHVGCPVHMHPMCAAQAGMHSRRLHPGEEVSHAPYQFAVSCSEHAPRGLHRLSRFVYCKKEGRLLGSGG
ncbi:unnamed protein product, partial [Discosporangium mesarthrocarpum]